MTHLVDEKEKEKKGKLDERPAIFNEGSMEDYNAEPASLLVVGMFTGMFMFLVHFLMVICIDI